jgi:hypothetical protein
MLYIDLNFLYILLQDYLTLIFNFLTYSTMILESDSTFLKTVSCTDTHAVTHCIL